MQKLVSYVTRDSLKMIAAEGSLMGFNRQIDPSILKTMAEGKFAVAPILVHKHIAGRRAAPHMRCSVTFKIEGETEHRWAIIDMKMRRFNDLPRTMMDEDRITQFEVKEMQIVAA